MAAEFDRAKQCSPMLAKAPTKPERLKTCARSWPLCGTIPALLPLWSQLLMVKTLGPCQTDGLSPSWSETDTKSTNMLKRRPSGPAEEPCFPLDLLMCPGYITFYATFAFCARASNLECWSALFEPLLNPWISRGACLRIQVLLT